MNKKRGSCFSNKNLGIKLTAIAASLLLLMFAALSIGLPEIGFAETVNIFMSVISGNGISNDNLIIFGEIRFPRIWLAVIAGAGLALSGTGTQAVLCNPLVSPSILGLTSGAALGASVAILYGVYFTFAHEHAVLMLFAFLGALSAIGAVYLFSSIKSGSRETVILAGVAISYIFSGITVFLQYIAPYQDLRAIIFWTVGSLWNADLLAIQVLTPVVLLGGIVFYVFSIQLNSLLLGEESSVSVGVNVKKIRLFSLMLSAFISASIISFTGAIGFVGLIAPHIARSLFGVDHRWLIPSSMLMGGMLLLLSDSVARYFLWPEELPVGVMTSMIGGPFFLYQLLRRKKDWWL